MRNAPSGTFATLAHRSLAHGGARVDGTWDYAVVRGIHKPQPTLFVRLHVGGIEPVDVDISVCTHLRTRPMCWPLKLVEPGTWRVFAARYGANLQHLAVPMPFIEGLPAGSLDLVGAPEEIEAEMSAIEDVLGEP